MFGVTNGQNIQEFLLKCKRGLGEVLHDWGLFAVIVLVSLSSFGLGRISVLVGSRPPVMVCQAPKLEKPRGIYPGGQFVAKRGGDVYYLPWCGGAQKIPQNEQVWFATVAAAEKAGYAPASNCRGL